MMKILNYPIKNRTLKDVLSQKTLDMLFSNLEEWQQGPGVFGKLHLHACWGTVSVLDKGYQGESVHQFDGQMKLFRRVYEKTGNPKWRMLEDAMASHLLYLQEESGGFIHSGAEFEPMFSTVACPIHLFLPMLALSEYYNWPHANEDIKALIPDALKRHFEFAVNSIWKVGNNAKRPLDFPGWCGVTNQDLFATAAIALFSETFNFPRAYETYGKPVLDYYLSPAYYYKEIGLFERGDGKNFAERTMYLDIILTLLWQLYEIKGETAALDAYYNVAGHLFDALFQGEDGLTYLARGAKTHPTDKSKVLGWEYGAVAFDGYPGLIGHMEEYLRKYPNGEKEKMVEALKNTLAAYVREDGTIPLGLWNPNPVFSLVSNPEGGRWAQFIMDELGEDGWSDPQKTTIPCIHRTLGDFTWKQKGRYWTIEEKGVRAFGGYTRYAAGVVKGPDEMPVLGDFNGLEQAEILEQYNGDYLETGDVPHRCQ